MRMTRLIPLALATLAAGPALAGAESLCLDAARVAAERTGVPYAVLLAISQTETGRNRGGSVQPWPWTINDSGDGAWFDSRQEAETYAEGALAAGRTSFDLGCFQLNYRWHNEGFASLDAMLDPEQNALYAARFLAQLHAESGDWSVAAGAYHSRTEVYADRYRERFDALLAAAGGEAAAPVEVAVIRENTFPLLQPVEGHRAIGSLVPLGNEG